MMLPSDNNSHVPGFSMRFFTSSAMLQEHHASSLILKPMSRFKMIASLSSGGVYV
jgi:hypothetical protein